MAPKEAWSRVALECPCRILASLHREGRYRHGTSARYPGKVLCCPTEMPLPEGWTPTSAQVQAWRAGGGPGD
jgi:hypothetical protein